MALFYCEADRESFYTCPSSAAIGMRRCYSKDHTSTTCAEWRGASVSRVREPWECSVGARRAQEHNGCTLGYGARAAVCASSNTVTDYASR